MWPSNNGPRRRRGPKKNGAKMYTGDPVVNHVNLLVEPFRIEETLVKRILGANDMYQDASQPTAKQQRHIESLFGKLESEASPIFRKIVKAFEKGDAGLWITRQERNRIRKFLFLLKYRGSTFHRRFYHVNASDYNCDDQEGLRDYMRDKGFERPVDVWFNNIKVIAELDMDVEQREWMAYLLDHIYPTDATWFVSHVQTMYMAICSPSGPSEEFVLTDNSYNVFEGVNSFITNPKTAKSKSSTWVNFHEFAPISPKLMIVLRSFIMPVPEEDGNEDTKEERDWWRRNAVDCYFGHGRKSDLEDLPIRKPRNNYSEIVNGQVRLINKDWKKSKGDKFCFSFFRIGTEHVNKINSYMLENAHACTSVIFGSRDSFAKTLEWYMTAPCDYMKKVLGETEGQKLRLLKNLGALMNSLGSSADPVWDESPKAQPLLSEFEQMELMNEGMQVVGDMMTDSLKESETKLNPAYLALVRFLVPGGTRLPPPRVWLYSQKVKFKILYHSEEVDIKAELESGRWPLDSPEDIIAEAACRLVENKAKLNRLIYNTALNSGEREKNPAFNPWVNVTVNTPRWPSLVMQTDKFISLPGQLRECGIPSVEHLAREEERRIIERQLYRAEAFNSPFYDEAVKVELLTRICVRPKFRRAIGDEVGPGLLKKMEAVFFDFTYPAPPVR
ncbi:hypothetical protein SLS62_011131 [Diatrype stigma]|uniref:Uncharacterized protein n=1 Tax=Diatrype stigma TaxID=117547 RepID=A0AAN9U4Y1_9PEZI